MNADNVVGPAIPAVAADTATALVDDLVNKAQASARGVTGHVDEDDGAMAVVGFRPILPDGVYEARFVEHQTAIVFGSPKIFLWFQIVESGPYFETKLFRAFRVRALKGKPSRNGRFVAGVRGELYPLLTELLDLNFARTESACTVYDHCFFVSRPAPSRGITNSKRSRPRPGTRSSTRSSATNDGAVT